MNYFPAENLGRDLGENWLFKGLTFSILQDEKRALISSKRSGKTTLPNMVAGITETDGSEISV
jgi:ABC transport system ATP-binding/permease protein